MADKRILVIGELDQKDRLTSLTNEMVGGARKLAGELGGGVDLLLITSGKPVEDSAGRSIDKIYIAADPGITVLDIDSVTSIVADVCKKSQPALCLVGQTDMGRDLAPRLAARLEAGLCMDCTAVKYDAAKDAFVQERPAYGGKAMSEVASEPGRLQINTVRSKSMSMLEGAETRTAEKIAISKPDLRSRLKLVNCERIQEEGIRLEDARVIVAGGGGVGKEGFEMMGKFAQVLNGAVGATRVPVDEKWVPHNMEIGQTGKIVSPDIYIAIGISGATQHITGILASGKIIAINKDPDANIFRVADYGLVADYKDAVPVLIEKLKEKLG